MTLACLMLVFGPLPDSSDGAGPAGSQPVFSVPASIVSDCSVDMTAALHAWIASVPDNSTLKFGKDACYNVDGGLIIADRHGLTFDGNGSTFRVFSRGQPNRSNWTIRAGSKITLRNMIARGAHPNAGVRPGAHDPRVEWQHAYRFQATQTGTLDNVQAYDVYGDFVEAEPDWTRVNPWPGVPARNITVRNSRFERNGRMGFGLTHVDGFVLEASYVGDVALTAIDLELDGSVAVGRNVRIIRNKFGRVQHVIFASAGHGGPQSVGNVVFAHNEMIAGPVTCMPPVYVHTPSKGVYWSTFTFESNSLKSYSSGFDLKRLKDVTVRNNTLAWSAGGGCGRESLVWAQDSHGGLVAGNTVTNAPSFYSIYQTDGLSRGFSVSNNRMTR